MLTMPSVDPHAWSSFTPFRPEQGIVIRRPEANGPGYWVGAPTVFCNSEQRAIYLVYRMRRPRGVEPDRGAEVRIARSSDGIAFDDVWRGTKDQLGTSSIERCALARDVAGRWLFYVSYVDPADGRWRIDCVAAESVETIRLEHARPVLLAADVGVEGVKDPWVFQVAGLYHMLVSFAAPTVAADQAELHATHDAYNTGLIRSATGLATSDDGRRWQWEGEIFGPSREGWDRYCARLGCLWRHDGLWLALYDGSHNVTENYEERCGLAYSLDLRTFQRVTRERPLMTTAHGAGAVRYFDAVVLPDRELFYYELAQPDDSHDLRVFQRRRG